MNFRLPRQIYTGGRRALGRMPVGGMNKTEQAYADRLEAMRRNGFVLWFEFEAIKLRLADNTFYTPDFTVMAHDGVIEFHEVKGFWEDDARVKIKVAAKLFPFRFKAMTPRSKKLGGGYNEETFSHLDEGRADQGSAYCPTSVNQGAA
jgi:hypothetical protein